MKDSDIIYLLQVDDVQSVAQDYWGRKLTKDELARVKDGIGWGFEDWEVIVRSAIWDVLHLNDSEDPDKGAEKDDQP